MTNSKLYIINGKELEMFTIGELAKRLDRQLQTLRKWETLGVIPQATYRSGTNRRLYTKNQIESIVHLVKKYRIKQGQPIPQEFKDEVADAFREATQKDFEEEPTTSS
jgi:DNA-binding transcriptional MerR regulator